VHRCRCVDGVQRCIFAGCIGASLWRHVPGRVTSVSVAQAPAEAAQASETSAASAPSPARVLTLGSELGPALESSVALAEDAPDDSTGTSCCDIIKGHQVHLCQYYRSRRRVWCMNRAHFTSSFLKSVGLARLAESLKCQLDGGCTVAAEVFPLRY
jgi:hypothetical protein